MRRGKWRVCKQDFEYFFKVVFGTCSWKSQYYNLIWKHLNSMRQTGGRFRATFLSKQRLGSPPLFEDRLDRDEGSQLCISNQRSCYQLKYGSEYKNLLDPRDQVMEHKFNFNFNVHDPALLKEGDNFFESRLYEKIKRSVKEFLVEAVSNVVSAGFLYLNRADLQENQSKEFAAKNIFANIHAIFRETIKGITENEELRSVAGQTDLKELKDNLIVLSEKILKNILINQADNYPQAPASGGTPRMREVITDVDRTDDEENDLIWTSGIRISDYVKIKDKGHPTSEKIVLSENEEYTEFVMKVINSAILVTQDNKEDKRDRTLFQKFREFNQELFWITSEKWYQQEFNSDSVGEGGIQMWGDVKKKEQGICQIFEGILTNQSQHGAKAEEVPQKKGEEGLFDFSSKLLIEKKDEKPEGKFDNQLKKAEEGIAKLKTEKKYVLGQKIPASVKPFSKQELVGKQFSAKHSSVLRILTKWAGYLQEVFKQPELVIKQRHSSFKNVHNKMIQLRKMGVDKIIHELQQEYKFVQEKFKSILQTSYQFIGNFLSADKKEDFISSVSRFTQTRTISSKISTVLTSLMLKYINILIHHLLKAGSRIKASRDSTDTFQNVNLITFRVSDIMRSKYQCSESTFITMLKTMYLLDNSENMQGKFKLIRIKNKLDDSANNIIVNYLFMGRVQCQLQLSIQDMKSKEKNYFAFSHFVYQLTRGNFGCIAECAIMISQLDPMINASRGTYYEEKEETVELEKEMSHEGKPGRKVEQKKIVLDIFQCGNCRRLIQNEHPAKYATQNNRNVCYACVVRNNPEQNLKEQLRRVLESESEKRLDKYDLLRNLNGEKYAISLNSSGELTLHIVLHLENQLKTFMVKVNNQVLSEIGSQQFNFDNLDYVDMSKEIKKGIKKGKGPANLTYLYAKVGQIPEELLKVVGVEKGQLTERSGAVVEEFKEFRLEKRNIKAIKDKTEAIKFSSEEEWRVFRRVSEILTEEGRKDERMQLRYRKEERISLQNLKEISASLSEIKEIPDFILFKCLNLKILDLQSCSIKEVKADWLSASLVKLNLAKNFLSGSLDLSSVHKLKQLYLYGNKLEDLKLNCKQSLLKMDISKNKIKQIDIQGYSTLRQANLKNNQLASVVLSKNSHLQQLNVCYNKLKQFQLGDSHHLKVLYLNNNQLQIFSIGSNNSLVEVNVSANSLGAFELGSNGSIKTIELNNNKLSGFKVGKGNVVEKLWLAYNQLKEFSFQDNCTLKFVDLKSNELESLALGKNSRIEEMNISENKLKQFNFGSGTFLKVLDMHTNSEARVLFDKNCKYALQNLKIDDGPGLGVDIRCFQRLKKVGLWWKEKEEQVRSYTREGRVDPRAVLRLRERERVKSGKNKVKDPARQIKKPWNDG